jgi:hypothetical protein
VPEVDALLGLERDGLKKLLHTFGQNKVVRGKRRIEYLYKATKSSSRILAHDLGGG